MKTTTGRPSLRTPALAILLGTAAVASTWSGTARAQGGSGAPSGSAGTGGTTGATSPADRAAAQVHFKKAKELYQSGAYHEAATELEAALALDPNARELIFNLGVVDERLGRIDDALAQFHRYQSLDLTAAERARSDSYIRRLEGAKKTLAPPPPVPVVPVTPPPAPVPPPQPPPPPEPAHGRMDAAAVTTLAIGGAGVVAGAVFGVLAITQRPHGYMTGTDGQTYASYQDAQSSYHRDATVSTVALAAGGAFLATGIILYFARTRDADDGSASARAAAVLDSLGHGVRF